MFYQLELKVSNQFCLFYDLCLKNNIGKFTFFVQIKNRKRKFFILLKKTIESGNLKKIKNCADEMMKSK